MALPTQNGGSQENFFVLIRTLILDDAHQIARRDRHVAIFTARQHSRTL